MKLKYFAIYDKKAQAYMSPITEHNKMTALRSFSLTCEKEDTLFHARPEDYSMCYIGEFDDNTGLFIPLEKPEVLADATEFVKKGLDNA